MGGFRFSKLDIILNRIIKEIDILEYHTDVSQQTVKGIFLHILSADGDAAAVYIPKAGNQIAKGRLAGTGRPDNRSQTLIRDCQRNRF